MKIIFVLVVIGIIFYGVGLADDAPLIYVSGTSITVPEQGTIQAQKQDDYHIQVIKMPVATEPVIISYSYDFLLSQKLAIEKQRDDFLAQRQKELDEVNTMIKIANDLGIKKQGG